MCRPQLTTDGQVNPGLALNVDFRDDAPLSVPATTIAAASLWDVALWDDALWSDDVRVKANWDTVDGIGYCASIRLAVDIQGSSLGNPSVWGVGLWGSSTWGAAVANEVTLQVNAFDVVFEIGSIV